MDGLSLAANVECEAEWWYYHGHLAGAGRHFGFHLAFFRMSTATLGMALARWLSPSFWFAHFALTDVGEEKFHYGQRRALRVRRGAEIPGQIRLKDWQVRRNGQWDEIRAQLRNVQLQLEIRPLKEPVHHGRGVGQDSTARYSSCSRLEAQGRVCVDGQEIKASGEAWMDRESGEFPLSHDRRGWDWFGLQFEDGRELVIYRIHDERGETGRHSLAAMIERDIAADDPDGATDDCAHQTGAKPADGQCLPDGVGSAVGGTGDALAGRAVFEVPRVGYPRFDVRGVLGGAGAGGRRNGSGAGGGPGVCGTGGV